MNTVTAAPVRAEHPALRPGPAKTWSDTLTLARRNLRHMAREPFEPVIALSMPVLMVLLFGYVFGGVMSPTGDETDYRAMLVPAMIVMVMFYGIAGTASGVARDTSLSVMSRFRTLPMSPAALLWARVLTDMLRAVAEVALLLGVGLLLGWRPESGAAGAAAAVGLLLLFRLSLVCAGVLLGLVMPGPDTASMLVYPLAFPLTMLSTSFVPAQAMPDWLAPVAEWNPVSSVVTATRELFGNSSLPLDSWPAEHAVLLTVGLSLVLIVLVVPPTLRRFARLNR